MADKAASVLAKLKNKARATGISYQQCLQLFFQEEFCAGWRFPLCGKLCPERRAVYLHAHQF